MSSGVEAVQERRDDGGPLLALDLDRALGDDGGSRDKMRPRPDGAARAHPAATLIAAAALSVLLIHSFVDHLLEFPPVMLILGAVLGFATANGPPAASRASNPSARSPSR